MELRVEITPLAFNKTAVYFLIRDTVRYLLSEKYNISLHALGEPIELSEFVDNDLELSEASKEKFTSRLDHILEGKETINSDMIGVHARQTLSLVFDPLYIEYEFGSRKILSFVHDLTPVTRPDWHRQKVSSAYARAFRYLYRKDIEILAVSQSTARDLWANYGIPRRRVNIISLYDRFSPHGGLVRDPKKIILFVGSLETRKNVVGLIKAFEFSDLFRKGFTLHIVGGDGYGAREIRESASRIEGVLFRGRISDKDLEDAYRQCCCLAYPSFWEGFGLPALEALNRGIPILLSNSGALSEVGGVFAVYADPCDIRSISNALLEVCSVSSEVLVQEDHLKKINLWTERFCRENFMKKLSTILESSMNA